YVRTARAKGLPEVLVVIRHILRNALIPVVTSLGLLVSGLISGSVFLDNIFGLAGFGGLISRSISMRDYPMLMSTIMVSAFLVMGSNLLVDMLYPLVDPRVTYD
ncbi:MAG: ABC transporter permease, partial [Chloroflexi bacterium]|nr:ABC transporter permease [Chloroflexota bacterium]